MRHKASGQSVTEDLKEPYPVIFEGGLMSYVWRKGGGGGGCRGGGGGGLCLFPHLSGGFTLVSVTSLLSGNLIQSNFHRSKSLY